MSVPRVTSRGTKRESQPPLLWETLQEGNLRLRRQPQPPLVNMFFKLFYHAFYLYLSFNLFSPFNTSQSTYQLMTAPSDFTNLKLRRTWDGATCGIPLRVRERCTTDNRRTFHSLLLPCNICKMLLFPTTPPPSRSLHPHVMHTHRCRHMHTRSHNILYLCSKPSI